MTHARRPNPQRRPASRPRRGSALAEAHHVARLEAFGSAVTDRLHGESDVDLLVSFRPMRVLEHGTHFFGPKGDLEALFGRRVDLLESDALADPYFLRAIASERVLLYAA